MDAGDLSIVMAKVREYVDSLLFGGYEGVIADGSWRPAEGTVDVILGDTFSCFTDGGDQPIVVYGCQVAVPDVGDQSGPTGGERVVLQRTQSGWIAKAHHGPDDTPNVPAGQRWITGKALYKIATLGGWTLQIDDAGKAATLTSPGGLAFKLDDNAALASIVGALDLGATGLDTSLDAVIAKRDADSLAAAIISTVQTWAKANFAAGTNGAAPPMTAPTSTGSSKVRAAQ